ncbi:hypothetical protein HMPREF1255_0644 [Propionimicrobium sp. BV2F7]|nr:hypothetical protein HMPREF1255_0644 [Propionimicrobium sp. BV2F7]
MGALGWCLVWTFLVGGWLVAFRRLWDSGLCVTGNVSPLLIQALWRLDIVALATP